MAILRIQLEASDPVVREAGRALTKQEIKSVEMQSFFDDMIESMMEADGIGIAACQVGRALNAAIIHKDYTPGGEHMVIVNPRIVSHAAKVQDMDEGCLSVPHVFGPVDRYAKVRVKAVGRHGEPLDLKARGMFARILQHEIDHLNAIVFIDRAEELYDRP